MPRNERLQKKKSVSLRSHVEGEKHQGKGKSPQQQRREKMGVHWTSSTGTFNKAAEGSKVPSHNTFTTKEDSGNDLRGRVCN